MRRFFSIVAILCLSLSAGWQLAFAEINYEMVSYTSNSKDASTPFLNLAFFNKPYFTINYVSFSSGFQFLFDLVIGISIATAVIVFMVGAYEGILDPDRGNTAGRLQGKALMQSSIRGLMIVLSAWLIINTINPDLLRLPAFVGLDQIAQVGQQQNNSPEANVNGDSF